jgi:putative ABC transport system ATP-binding protein
MGLGMNPFKETKTDAAIDITGLSFTWRNGQAPVIEIENLQIDRQTRVFIEGPSGSGKSTLLSLMAGIVTPRKGVVRVNGEHINAMNGPRRDRFRADHIGFIYQMFNLIPYLSVVENVTLPCRFSARRRDKAKKDRVGVESEARRLLDQLGMGDPDLIHRPVTELSVGQQQRVAAARALIGTPEIMIADEPTSSLDADRREAFIRLLFQECGREDMTLIFVSHDTALASLFDRTIRLGDINQLKRPDATNT